MSEIIKDTIDTTGEFVEVEKKTSLLEKGKDVGSKVLTWSKDKVEKIKEDPAEAFGKLAVISSVVAGAVLTLKTAKDIKDLDRTVYSEEINEGVVLKKKLNNDAKVELDYRMKTGQTKIEALKDMDLIK